VVWWRKRNEGFEWRDYVRTTILVRREHRRRRLDEAKQAAAAHVKEAGKRSIEAGASGAQAASSAAWRFTKSSASRLSGLARAAGRGAVAATGAAAHGTATASSAIARAVGTPLAPVVEPVLAYARPSRARKILAGVALLAVLGAAVRTWSFGFDTDARVAAALAAVIALVLALAILTDPDRSSARPERESLLDRLGAHRGGLAESGWLTPRPIGLALLAVVVLAGVAGLWSLLAPGTAYRSAPVTTAALPERDPSQLAGRAVAVTGDTLRLAGKLVTLDGIEAPEPTQSCKRASGSTWRCGAAAKDALASLLRNRRITCDVLGETADRPRVRCYVHGNDIAETLVRKGSVFSSGGFLARYSSVEGEAQDAKAGLWSGTADRPQDFRDKRWQEAKKTAPDGCPIKGRVRSGTRIYVMPWSPGYEAVRLRPSRGERWFCSEDEAAAAGWSHESQS